MNVFLEANEEMGIDTEKHLMSDDSEIRHRLIIWPCISIVSLATPAVHLPLPKTTPPLQGDEFYRD